MLVINQPIDIFHVKAYSTKIGYHYKIFYGKKLVAQSYVYFHRMDDCYRRMMADIELLKETKDYYDNKP